MLDRVMTGKVEAKCPPFRMLATGNEPMVARKASTYEQACIPVQACLRDISQRALPLASKQVLAGAAEAMTRQKCDTGRLL